MLYRFGASLLGYDALNAQLVTLPKSVVEAIPSWHKLTEDPRKYGFHATLKAPFRLSSGAVEADLVAAFEEFTGGCRTIPVIRPVARLLRHFIAIVNDAPNADLTRLADDCVTVFESFRAPLTLQDRERRLKSPLSSNQIAMLDRWGYPYVFEEFFFHMSLTGRIEHAARAQTLEVIAAQFARLDQQSLAIDRLALFRQDHPSAKFTAIRHIALRG